MWSDNTQKQTSYASSSVCAECQTLVRLSRMRGKVGRGWGFLLPPSPWFLHWFSLLINHCPPSVSPRAPPLLVHLENVLHADTKVTFHQVQSNTLCNIYRPPHPRPPSLPSYFPSSASSADPFGMKVLRRWMMPLNFITAFPSAALEFCRRGFHCSFSATGCILPDLFEATLMVFREPT